MLGFVFSIISCYMLIVLKIMVPTTTVIVIYQTYNGIVVLVHQNAAL